MITEKLLTDKGNYRQSIKRAAELFTASDSIVKNYYIQITHSRYNMEIQNQGGI